ncbi:pali-domain-containing protein [Xylariomycetidae sp. FL2044]|nr:pali-domain-containing protein [Xylariomycetidae sp. FL2044]
MLRPATPLAILLFAAFAMLLLSVLSTPIIQAIPLGTYEGVSFGVFGYCHTDGCSPIEIGYDTAKIYNSPEQSDTFDLPTATRTTLSAILVVHPVACFLTLVMLVLALVAHMHSPSHSSRYLLLVFIFGILTFLVCLLAFLIDVLLFVPHMAWGSYIVLAATILVFLSFIVSCAMRRTLVSRKARKKRIAENAEMSGENYYNRQAQQDAAATATPSVTQPTVPVLSGANGAADKLPTYASYENRDDRSSDERIPLTARSPSERSPNNATTDMSAPDGVYNARRRSGSIPSLPRDQYGNPINQSPDTYGIRRGPSAERGNLRGRGGPPGGYYGRGGHARGGYAGGYGPPPNARGGYGPPGRGGYGPGPNGRGGYGPPRGGYGPPRGGYGRTPPPGYSGASYDRRPPPAGAYGNYGSGRQPSPGPQGAPYGANPSMPSVSTGPTGNGTYDAYNSDRVSELPRAESPPPLPGTEISSVNSGGPEGHGLDMNARADSPAHAPGGFGQFNNQLRDSDADVAGMLALQQARTSNMQRHDTLMSEGSKYSQDESQYIPPRQAWAQGQGRSSPAHPSAMPPALNVSTRPREVPSGTPPPPAATGSGYYEDVDPRFAEPSRSPANAAGIYEDVHNAPGSRSPAISERSGFTSISQRGVNPRWNPPPGQGYGQQMPPRRPVGRNEVNVLNSNPDFQLPASRGGSASPARGPGSMVPNGAYPGL